jgi:hypothetical protein
MLMLGMTLCGRNFTIYETSISVVTRGNYQRLTWNSRRKGATFVKEEDFIRITQSTHVHEDEEDRQPRRNTMHGNRLIANNPNIVKRNCLETLKGSSAQIPSAV